MNSTGSSLLSTNPTKLAGQIVSVIFFFLICGGNALVIVAFSKYRTLQTVTNAFLLNLAVADLAYGAINMPILFFFNSPYTATIFIEYQHVCYLTEALFVTLLLTSLFTLLAVTVERYFAIVHPFTYMKHFEKRKVAILNLIIWLVTITYGALSLASMNSRIKKQVYCIKMKNVSYSVSLMVVLIVCLLTTTCVYIKIWRVARAHSKYITAQSMTKDKDARRCNQEKMSGNQDTRPGNRDRTNVNQNTPRCEFKLIKMLFLVLFFFYLSWVANVVYLGIYIFSEGITPFYTDIVDQVVGILMSISSFLNPLIYAGMNTAFRRAFQKLICCRY